MKNTDLERRLKPILGSGWQTKTARALYNGQVRTVQRLVAGEVEIQPYVVAAIELLEACVAAGVRPPARWEISKELEQAFAAMTPFHLPMKSTRELAELQGLTVARKPRRKAGGR